MITDRREQIKNIVERDFIGPDPIDWPGLTQENGEEILISDPPTTRYIAGILFPMGAKGISDSAETNSDPIELDDEVSDNISIGDEMSGDNYEILEDAEELIDRSNAYHQSAMSLTIAIKNDDEINVEVSAGVYKKREAKTENGGKGIVQYVRSPINWSSKQGLKLPNKENPLLYYDVDNSSLRVDFTFRYQRNNKKIYTVTLENTKTIVAAQIRDEECYFQVKMRINSKRGFDSLPEQMRINADEDYLSNRLLYRNIKNYAIGHGCAAEWTENEEVVNWIETAVFPSFEVKPIVPSVIPGVELSMLKMSKEENFEDVIQQLEILCEKYDDWISLLKANIKTIDDALLETAYRHVSNCETCLERMKRGVKLLASNKNVKQAFLWMNKAMLMQQIHYGLPLQLWTSDGDDGLLLENAISELPEIDDDTTWYNKEQRIYGMWRPFQLAFILINLDAMNNKECDERKIVDLIWFPTGGGKTEAYLGLSAYTIFIRRLQNKDDKGTAILMRYTLRLLTAQQYERASAVICACEIIREDNEALLGKNEISIGLWVGGDTTPNHQKNAVAKYKELSSHKTNTNPFVMLKCPWCGAQMGVADIDGGKKRRLPGYKIIDGPRKTQKFIFKCSNKANNCYFSKRKNGLPLYIIDDDIYEKKPTLILGTVDKFAMLPFTPEAQGIFGYDKNGVKITSPDLIIQDELHLISGPLGSMVGHYETMINELCTSGTISPKIIASTATISRAKEQCHALYGCSVDDVFQFPPSGLDAGDSFFANEDNTKNGRKYIGVLASASPSDATTMIRLYAALLYAAKKIDINDESERDAYWTNVGYFNSIRELGQAQTWIKADIDQYLDVMYKRRYDDKRFEKEEYKKYRRYIWRDEELTSRIPGDKVTASLANLNIEYPAKQDSNGKIKDRPIDICLATNMISVGLDVQRLGLMTVAGQPKTTSEYIQATSRVGRNASVAPGEIFVIYRPGRPRDKSFYEQFRLFHSKLYCFVEPTSVTPFSSPVRNRALHAILIGLLRLSGGTNYNDNPVTFPNDSLIDWVESVIGKRVMEIEPDEYEATIKLLKYLLECWEDWNPQLWTPRRNFDGSLGNEVPLLFSSSESPNVAWLDRGFPTPTSMRSVDASCEAKVLLNRYVERDE